VVRVFNPRIKMLTLCTLLFIVVLAALATGRSRSALRLAAVLVAVALVAADAPAQYCASPSTYRAPSYGYSPSSPYPPAYGGVYVGSVYTPTYAWSYHAAGIFQGRWYPAGEYAWIDNQWYRKGYGIEYGTPVATYCPPPVVSPTPGENALALVHQQNEFLFRLLLTAQQGQVPPTVVAPAPPAAPVVVNVPAAPGLTPAEVARLKALLAQVPAPKPE
jgi:hypothetical protein